MQEPDAAPSAAHNLYLPVAGSLPVGTPPISREVFAMPMTHIREVQTIRDIDIDSGLTLKVGAGAVDPRLIEPDHRELDIEELIAYWTSCL